MTLPPLPAWTDSPSTSSPIDSTNLLMYNTAIDAIVTTMATLAPQIPFTALQTTSYTALPNQYVLVSTTSGALTVTFPTAPANFTTIGVKDVVMGAGNPVTMQLGGSDAFETPTGPQTSTFTLVDQAGIWQYNALTAVWVKVSSDLPLSQLETLFLQSVTAANSTITMGGTATAPTVAVNQGNLTLAESQITGLATTLNAGYQAGGLWTNSVYGDLMSNMQRDDAGGTYAMSTRTQLVLLGLCPVGTYSVFKLYVTVAQSAGVMSAALFSSATLTGTSWARLGSGNVTPAVTATGLVSTSLAFTLASPAYVVLEMVATTAFTTNPTFAALPVSTTPVALLNPVSGCPVSATSAGTTAPGTTLNPTTGFTNIAQKIWCALA